MRCAFQNPNRIHSCHFGLWGAGISHSIRSLVSSASHPLLVHALCVVRFIIYFNARRIHEYFIDFTDSYLLLIRLSFDVYLWAEVSQFLKFENGPKHEYACAHEPYRWKESQSSAQRLHDGAILPRWSIWAYRLMLLPLHVHLKIKCTARIGYILCDDDNHGIHRAENAIPIDVAVVSCAFFFLHLN